MQQIHSKFSKDISLLFLAVIVFAIPFTLLSVQKQQQVKQNAAGIGHTYYVSKAGNNSDGLSYQTAWNELGNIQWSNILPGDRIIIDGGMSGMTYTTTLTVGKSGVQGFPITIQRSTDTGHLGRINIFGGRSIPLPYCGQTNYNAIGTLSHGIVIGASSWIIIDGMTWDGINIYGNNSHGIDATGNPSNDIFRNLNIYDNGMGGSGGPHNDGHGIYLNGSNLTFQQMDIHDNADDEFDGGTAIGVNNIVIDHSWLYVSREDPNNPGLPFNQCVHQDGYQIYAGGTQGPITIENSIVGPGLKEGTILGQTPNGANGATVNNVTIQNTLFLNKVNNIFGYPAVKETGWKIDHVTVWNLNTLQSNSYPSSIFLEGTGNSVTNSILYGGPIALVDGLSQSSNNCQWKTTGNTSAIQGQTIDPQFVTDISQFTDNTPFSTIANADYSIKSTSPCAGRGSSITSVAQLINTAVASPIGSSIPTIVITQPLLTTPPVQISKQPTPTTHVTSTPIGHITPGLTPITNHTGLTIYDNGIAKGFNDESFSYTSKNSCDTSTYVSAPCSFAITYGSYGGINLVDISGSINASLYKSLEYNLSTNNQPITDFSVLLSPTNDSTQVRLSDSNITGSIVSQGKLWYHISIPMSQLNPKNASITGIQLKNKTSSSLSQIHIDDLIFVNK